MKKIVRDHVSKVMSIRSLQCDGRNIVAYKTAGPTGMAILRWCDDVDSYGFVYLRDLLQGEAFPASYYNASKSKGAIENVMADNKDVFYFEDQYDFLRFASDPSIF